MIDLPWQLYVVLGVGSFSSLVNVALRVLEHRSTQHLKSAQTAVYRSEARVNSAIAAGLTGEARAKRQQARQYQAEHGMSISEIIKLIRVLRE